MDTNAVIRSNRLRLGLTEQQLADRIGVSRGSVQQWEKGTTAPKRANQEATAKALGIDVTTLMGMTSNTTANIKFSVATNEEPDIVAALHTLDQHLNGLAPVFSDAAREALRKWALGLSSIDDAANALQAMALASESLGKR
jgi:transcriptional regulator with XRE-family HTH domain